MTHPDPTHQTEPPAQTDQHPAQSAVALTYRDGMRAPKVVAKGRGLVAEEIIRRAQEAGVYVHESKELVALLMQIDLDDRIPPELYVAVAELLAWLYRLEAGLEQ
ncbi:EscU/YscU/HrcU family type III secretion system export apparatus switch protein [Nitrosomonas halophila]|uniref:Flagellar biosynthesis protein n=1 Tax=Nitrosomonas halophila TaxID=44576 RepID=A0A1H3K899_9PROT|nr:EscU/YscU/HrcU family type III secretion system export apparatus switch protein [Nitrosomonas halophila]SDY48391.1 flagellar biosynthesis protein [Nitrosomonas halophila]